MIITLVIITIMTMQSIFRKKGHVCSRYKKGHNLVNLWQLSDETPLNRTHI